LPRGSHWLGSKPRAAFEGEAINSRPNIWCSVCQQHSSGGCSAVVAEKG
jgi:hypothetical protein